MLFSIGLCASHRLMSSALRFGISSFKLLSCAPWADPPTPITVVRHSRDTSQMKTEFRFRRAAIRLRRPHYELFRQPRSELVPLPTCQ